MPFVDFLRTLVLLTAAAASALAFVALVGANADGDRVLTYVALGWWSVAAAVGLWLGRRERPSRGIARLLASARATHALPELEPGRIVVNRLWSFGLVTLVAGGVAFLVPQVPAIASGYALAFALAWRRQGAAVAAVEGRDGVRFYVESTSPFKPTRLLRTPGFRKFDPAEGSARERAGLPDAGPVG